MAQPETPAPQALSDAASGKGVLHDHPLAHLIGGPRGALESIVPPAAFIATYIATGDNMSWAIGVALTIGVAFAVWRIAEGKRPTRVLGALLLVVLSAYVAAKTGSAAAFFWPRVLVNLASALAFAISIFVRWPLIGVIIGPLLGTRMRWRDDPDLVRGYNRATWLWVLLCLVRAAILIPLIEQNALWGLALSGALFYGFVIVTVLLSWVVIKRALPDGHPGARHPRTVAAEESERQPG